MRPIYYSLTIMVGQHGFIPGNPFHTPLYTEQTYYEAKEQMFSVIHKVLNDCDKHGLVLTFGSSDDWMQAPEWGEVVVRIARENTIGATTALLPVSGGGDWPDFDIWWDSRKVKNQVTIN